MIGRGGEPGRYRFAFVVEQFLGHRTHYQNLLRFVPEAADVDPVFLPIEWDGPGILHRMPPFSSNATLRTSLRASRAVRRLVRTAPPDAILYHTQTSALLAPLARGLPFVVSLDATPINYDSLADHYGHAVGGPLEGPKQRIYRGVFRRAAALITWSHWAAASLVRDYGLPAEKVAVIPPGVDLTGWPRRTARERIALRRGGPVRLLFVGADFRRKGGQLLLEGLRGPLAGRCELHVVTEADLAPEPGLFVHRGLTPKSAELQRLYADADLFVFPTLADCYAQVVPEAMAAGLPVITTRIGATAEAVADGESGLTIEAGNAPALIRAVDTLLARPELRAAMGESARRRVEAGWDANVNMGRILALLRRVCAPGSPARDPGPALPAQTA